MALTHAGWIALALVLALPAAPAVAQQTEPTAPADLQAVEDKVRGLIEAWTGRTGGDGRITYRDDWVVRSAGEAIELAIPAFSFPLATVIGVEVAPQRVLYRVTGPDTYRLTWPQQDLTITTSDEGPEAPASGDPVVRHYAAFTGAVDMVDGDWYPRRFFGQAEALTVTPTGEFDTSSWISGPRMLGTMTSNTDGTYDVALASHFAERLYEGDATEAHLTDVSAAHRLHGVHPDTLSRMLAAMGLLLETTAAAHSDAGAAATASAMADLLTAAPDLLERADFDYALNGFFLGYNQWEWLGLDAARIRIALSDLSGDQAGAEVTVRLDGLSSDYVIVEAVLPSRLALALRIEDLQFASTMGAFSQLVRDPRTPPAVLQDALVRTGTQVTVGEFTLDYGDFAIETHGTATIDDTALLGVVADVHLLLINPDAASDFFSETFRSEAMQAAAAELRGFGVPTESTEDALTYALSIDPAGPVTINGRSAMVPLVTFFTTLIR